jgi:hypothetical protein
MPPIGAVPSAIAFACVLAKNHQSYQTLNAEHTISKFIIITSTHLITEEKTWAAFAVVAIFTITDSGEAIFRLGNYPCFSI